METWFTLLLSEVTKGQTWDGREERGQTCADRIPAHRRRTPFSDLLYVCVLPIDQLTDQHSASPAAVLGSPCKKGWAGIQLQVKKSFLAISDGQRRGEAHTLLLLLPEEAALPVLKEMVVKPIGAAEEAGYSTQLCHRGVGNGGWSANDCMVSLRCQASLSANGWPL